MGIEREEGWGWTVGIIKFSHNLTNDRPFSDLIGK